MNSTLRPGDVISWVGYKTVKPALVAGALDNHDRVTQCIPLWMIDCGQCTLDHHRWGVSTERLQFTVRST
jgi:hypothetical protein